MASYMQAACSLAVKQSGNLILELNISTVIPHHRVQSKSTPYTPLLHFILPVPKLPLRSRVFSHLQTPFPSYSGSLERNNTTGY